MNRRRFLATAGAAGLVAGAGCIDVLGDDEYPTETFQGETVPLAPLEDVHEWWEEDDARFVDARGERQYDAAHVPGAVLSPVAGERAEDPVDDWSRDERIVTYCNCPHSLAVQRAAGLLEGGFGEVYALEDGFRSWEEAGYPTESNDPDAEVTTYEIVGYAGPEHAGERGHVSTIDGKNYESVRIEEDGTYATTIRFPDLTAESELVVETPGYTREGTLAELVEGDVSAE